MHNLLTSPPPRNWQAISQEIDLKKGLRSGLMMGGAFLLWAFLMLGLGIFGKEIFPPGVRFFQSTVGLGFFGFLAWINGGSSLKRWKQRKIAVTQGIVVEGIVVGHKHRMVAYKKNFTGDLVLEIACLVQDKKVLIQAQSERGDFHERHPLGSTLKALFDLQTGASFVPAEIL